MDHVLFNIPVYLRNPEQYENERIQSENKMKRDWGSEYAMGKKIQMKWPPWEYNDVMGYFRIIICSSPAVHDLPPKN